MLNDRMAWARKQWDRVGAWVLIAAAAIVFFLGWLGVSSTPYPAEQLSYVFSAGMAGIFLLGVGTMLWLSADMRDEWYKLDRLEELVRGDLAVSPSESTGDIELDEGGLAETSTNRNGPGRRVRSTDAAPRL